MKIAPRALKKFMSIGTISLGTVSLSTTLLFTAILGCGKPSSPPALPKPELMKKVVGGVAAYGSHCPYGFVSEPKPSPLSLWDCKIPMEALELSKPLQPLLFQADCHKKTLSIRTADKKFDSFWEVMPDGSFDLMIPGGGIFIKEDGMGGECVSVSELEVWGKFKCDNRDRVTLELDTIWWLGKERQTGGRPLGEAEVAAPLTATPANLAAAAARTESAPSASIATLTRATTPSSPAAPPSPGASRLRKCQLPVGCYLHAAGTVRQCE